MVSERAVRLQDLGSTNGTFVNGVRVTEAILKSGQHIQLGSVKLMFEGDGEEAAIALQTPPVASSAPPPLLSATVASPTIARTRLAHAKPKEPPAEVAAPEADPATVEGEPLPALDSATNACCKYHPRTPARWLCTKCHKTYCDLCVTVRPGAAGSQKYCRSCGGLTAELEVTIEAPPEKSFFKELPRAVIYPFRGTGILILIATTLVFAALDFLSAGIIGWLMKAVALGYLFSYVQNIIHATAAGDDQLPELPAMDDLLSGFVRLVGTVLMSFGPALVLAYLAIGQEQPWAGTALVPAVLFGCMYLPMAFLAVAIKDNVMAANPLIVVPSILRVPLEYFVTAILVMGVFGIRWLGDAVSGDMAGRSMTTPSVSEMLLLFGLRALWAFVSVYLLTVTMRILGLLYLTKQDRLGWLDAAACPAQDHGRG